MKEQVSVRVSVLMDGELDDRSAAEVIEALGRDREAARTWGTYQLIGDALRASPVLSAQFSARFSERLAKEPIVFAPRALRTPESRRWYAASAAAASVAAVAFVGWMAFGPQPQQPAPVAQAQPAQPRDAKPNLVPLPTAANDYLLAHQGFSPRVSLQGMAPYVRTVSEQAVEPRK